MDLLFLFVLASILGALTVARVILWSTQRATSSAITSYFKASEYIFESGEPPPEWLANPRWRHRFRSPNASATHAEILARFDDLVRFFEHCSFFEDEWTREQMLAQLAIIRESWLDRDLASTLLQLEDRPHFKAR